MRDRNAPAQATPPDVPLILAGLKPFQQRSVEHVFDRLYGANHTRRFLLADEVGLGKTLVAKGVIAKAIEHLWSRVDRIDVVYICSNQDIARQNIARLNVTGCNDFALASRITMLPIADHRELRDRRLNFVSFTPGTSFDLKSTLGVAGERVLLYHLLRDVWKLSGNGPKNVLQGNAGAGGFRASIDRFRETIDPQMAAAFQFEAKNDIALRRSFETLCDVYHRADAKISDAQKAGRSEVVGKLRAMLARTCLQSLEPDLIILDEFQRFKHLLAGETEAAELAKDLFGYSDAKSEARVLLLSATPYKMYTMGHELAQEDHYSDFLSTLRFLLEDDHATNRVELLLKKYRRLIYRLGDSGDTTALDRVRDELQAHLRRVICRTERLAVTPDRSGMLREISATPRLESLDVSSYFAVQKVARAAEQFDAIEYWKAAPYLLSFMEDYALKHAIKERRDDPRLIDAVKAANADSGLTLPMDSIRAYRPVDARNPRLRTLAAQTLDVGAWRALWVPPSLPYYECAGAVGELTARGFTKRLVFSNWKVVPKAIATMLSYEAERRMMTSFDPRAENTPDARKAHRALLNFSHSKDRLTGMPLLGLLYPSTFLARRFDPARNMCEQPSGTRLTADEVVSLVELALADELEAVTSDAPRSGPADESWYWAAPLLLDLKHFREETLAWWNYPDLESLWSRLPNNASDPFVEQESSNDDSASGWAKHVDEARSLIRREIKLGRPPDDLSRVLAQITVGGPAVSALRAITRIVGVAAATESRIPRLCAGQIAFALRSLFNSPDVMSLIRGMSGEEPYWRRTLEYMVDGCLQAVLDEYAHVLASSPSEAAADPNETALDIAKSMHDALSLRVANPGVDDVWTEPRGRQIYIEGSRLRSRFAMRFGDEKSEDGTTTVSRADQVRKAFNSPFWPFVLATTSVGQEGLDFHTYCHAIVHWNLPSNPVDLEQREGRIHRYKGHAVRRNVASQYSSCVSGEGIADPWGHIFELAAADDAGKSAGLVPYWIFTGGIGAAIERHVPALPLSRETEQLPGLRNSLAIYRLAFGQPRQDDLVKYLERTLPPQKIADFISGLGLNLSPQHAPSAVE